MKYVVELRLQFILSTAAVVEKQCTFEVRIAYCFLPFVYYYIVIANLISFC